MSASPCALATLLWRSTRQALVRGLPEREVLRQIFDIGNRSALLVIGGMMFFGAVMMSHGAYQARKVVGDLSVVGPAYFELMIREFGPTMAGILAAVRAGAAISAEIASMQVNEQVDALQMSAGDPYSDLVMPRVIGGLIALPCLIIGGTLSAVIVSSIVATYVYNADGRAFMDATFIDAGDIAAFMIKSVLYGLFIPLASCSCGLAARGGAGAVGDATTRGVVASSVLVLIVDLGVSGLLQLAGI